jgi:hypothetical protein
MKRQISAKIDTTPIKAMDRMSNATKMMNLAKLCLPTQFLIQVQ